MASYLLNSFTCSKIITNFEEIIANICGVFTVYQTIQSVSLVVNSYSNFIVDIVHILQIRKQAKVKSTCLKAHNSSDGV